MSSKKKHTPVSQDIDTKIQYAIQEALRAGYAAGRTEAERQAKDPYKATEKRLYALPDLQKKVEDDKLFVEQLRTHGTPERSRSLVRFARSGYRATPEELLESMIESTEATIAADEHEIATVQRALDGIKDDYYYFLLERRYFEGDTDDQKIADEKHLDKTTIYRNRKRLVNRIAIKLYGSCAIE